MSGEEVQPLFVVMISGNGSSVPSGLEFALAQMVRADGGYPADVWTDEMLVSVSVGRGRRRIAVVCQTYKPSNIWEIGGHCEGSDLERGFRRVMSDQVRARVVFQQGRE